MATKKISELTATTTPTGADLAVIETAAGLYRKVLLSNLKSGTATATPTASSIPISSAGGKLDSWITDAAADGSTKGVAAFSANDFNSSSGIISADYTNGFAPIQGGLYNGYLSATVANNDLTLAIKTMAGADPTSSAPIYVRIGNAVRSITSALSVTAADGTNWCNLGAAEHATQDVDLFAYIGYNATDGVVIGFSRIPNGRVYSDFSSTSTNEKFCKISTITNAAAADVYENVGRFNATLSAGAGYTWTIPATAIVFSRPIYETRWLTYAPIITGFSVNPSNAVYQYKISFSEVNVSLSQVTNGTSNATTFTISLPFTSKTITNMNWMAGGSAIDNGSTLTTPALANITSAATVIDLYPTYVGGSAWTNTNGKRVATVNISYQY